MSPDEPIKTRRKRKGAHLKILQFEDKAPRDFNRPVIREDCLNMARPCPYVACKYHLFLDLEGSRDTTIRVTHGNGDEEKIDETLKAMRHTCVLDVVEAGIDFRTPPRKTYAHALGRYAGTGEAEHGLQVDVIAELMGLPIDRVKAIEHEAMLKIKTEDMRRYFEGTDFLDDNGSGDEQTEDHR